MRPSITGKRATLLVSLFVLVATVVQYDLLKFSHRQLENNDGRAGEIIPSEKIPRDLKKYLQRLRDAAVELRTEQRMLQSKNDTDGEQHQGRNPLEIARIRRAQFGIIFPEAEKMPLHLRNTMDSLHSNDVVFFWHIPKTGGKLMRVIMGNCFGLRRAERLKEPAVSWNFQVMCYGKKIREVLFFVSKMMESFQAISIFVVFLFHFMF